MIESTPAAKATEISATIRRSAPAPDRAGVRAQGRAAGACSTPLRPPPCVPGSSARRAGRSPAPHRGARERQDPGKPVEALSRRRGEHGGPELRDELVLDLLLGRALRDALPDQALDPARGGCVGLVERGLARRTDELALQVGRARTGGGDRGQNKSRHDCQQEPHAPRTSCTQSWNRSLLPSRWTPACSRSHTSLPERATKNVSGTPVKPYLVVVLPGPS